MRVITLREFFRSRLDGIFNERKGYRMSLELSAGINGELQVNQGPREKDREIGERRWKEEDDFGVYEGCVFGDAYEF